MFFIGIMVNGSKHALALVDTTGNDARRDPEGNVQSWQNRAE